MNDEIQTLMMSLRFEFGWVLGFTAWVTVLRITFVWFNTQLQEFAEQNVKEQGSIQALFDSLPYRILAFLIKMLTSIKLLATGRKAVAEAKPTPLPLP